MLFQFINGSTILFKTNEITKLEETICKDIRKFIKPRLNTLSVKTHEKLFRQLLISLSLSGLSKVVKIYEASKQSSPNPIEPNQLLLMRNAVDCIYNCPRTDQLQETYAIINCLPLKSSGKFGPQYDEVFNAIETLETYLQSASILEKYGICKPLITYQQIEIDYSLRQFAAHYSYILFQ